MSQIQYITDGYNQSKERVILWRLADYQYQLEIAGKDHNFGASYEEAIAKFNQVISA